MSGNEKESRGRLRREWATPPRSPRCSIGSYITPTYSNAGRMAGFEVSTEERGSP